MIIAFECQKLVKKLEKSSILSNFQHFSVFGPYLQKIQIATPPSFFELETPFFQTNYLWGTQFFAPVPILEFPHFDPPLGRKTDFLRCFSAKRGGQNAEIPKSGLVQKNVFPIRSLSEKWGL